MSEEWTHGLLTEEEAQRMSIAGFGKAIGFGAHCAVIVIDVQNYMVGPPGGSKTSVGYPSACPTGRAAVNALVPLLTTARERDVPVVYTRFALAPDASDIGVYGSKRAFLQREDWCIEGTLGAEIVPSVSPDPSDIVLVKKKPSAFFGTHLLSLLIDRRVDTVIVTGGSTSNCVRATVVDAASYNFRPIVVSDCVFDRFSISHRVALFDMARQYADVLNSQQVIENLH